MRIKPGVGRRTPCGGGLPPVGRGRQAGGPVCVEPIAEVFSAEACNDGVITWLDVFGLAFGQGFHGIVDITKEDSSRETLANHSTRFTWGPEKFRILRSRQSLCTKVRCRLKSIR